MHKAKWKWLIFHFCFSTCSWCFFSCSWCFFSFSCHHPKLAFSDFLGVIAVNNLSQLLPLSFLINSGYKWKIHCLCLQNLQALHCLQDKLKILLIGFKDSHNLIYHPIECYLSELSSTHKEATVFIAPYNLNGK